MADKKLTTIEIDAITGENFIRELTTNEIEQLKQAQNDAKAEIALREAKAAARQSALAKLAELGLTEEEIAAL